MPWLRARRRLEILRFRSFRMVRLSLSCTLRSAMILKSPTRETKSILSLGGKACSLMERGGTPWRLGHLCSLLLVPSTASRTFHPTLSFGWFSTGRKEGRQVVKAGLLVLALVAAGCESPSTPNV